MMTRSKKTPSNTTERLMTPDELRIAMNRLSLRLVRETDQSVCDALEIEYQVLLSRLPPPTPTPVRQPDGEELIIVPSPPRRMRT